MEPEIDEPTPESQRRYWEQHRDRSRDIYNYASDCARYVPYFWARTVEETKPKRPSPDELAYTQDVRAEDVEVFPELKGRRHVRMSLCEDGEVYELPEQLASDPLIVTRDVLRMVLQRAAQGESVDTLFNLVVQGDSNG